LGELTSFVVLGQTGLLLEGQQSTSKADGGVEQNGKDTKESKNYTF